MEIKRFTAREEYARADVFLSKNLTGYTRSAVKKLFDGGLVTINGKASKASQTVPSGACAEVALPDAAECTVKPEDIPIEIVY